MPRIRHVSGSLALAMLVTAGCGQGAEDLEQAQDLSHNDGTTGAEWLYVQSAAATTIEPAGDQWTVVLTEVSPVTTGFTDRPDRETQNLSTEQFVLAWDSVFGDDPPNAGLTLLEDNGETITVTINAATYDANTAELRYSVALLDNSAAADIGQGDLGGASIFIDDAAAWPGGLTAATKIQVAGSAATQPLVVEYQSLVGNEPNTFGNRVFVWSGEWVDGSASPVESVAVDYNIMDGSVELPNLSIPGSTYTIGYATGPDASSVAATVSVEPDGTTTSSSLTIDLVDAGRDEMTFTFRSPGGIAPDTTDHWIGVFEGEGDLFNAQPIARASVPKASAGEVSVPVQIRRATTYVVGYFTGSSQTTLAATATFDS